MFLTLWMPDNLFHLAGLGGVWSDGKLGHEGWRDNKMTRRIATMV